MDTRQKLAEMKEDKETYSDAIVEGLIQEYRMRSLKGIAKYRTTLEDNQLSLNQWLQHAKEEAMDMALYLHKAQKQLNG
jgi:predicted CopG family antitoxin